MDDDEDILEGRTFGYPVLTDRANLAHAERESNMMVNRDNCCNFYYHRKIYIYGQRFMSGVKLI